MNIKATASTIFITAVLFLITLTSVSQAQTIYKSDSGFFTPVLESFFLRGGVFEDTQLIGPAIGYRFNETYDVALHTEFLFSETHFNNTPDPKLSLLNLGVTIGQTNRWENRLLLRNELSIYKSFNLSLENYPDFPDPSLTSVLGSSSIYKPLKISDSITFLPNIGVMLGIGNYQIPFSTASLRQGFDGFVAGPKLGLDTVFKLGDSFSLTAKPQYRLRYNFTNEHSVGTLTFNIQLNF